MNFYKMMMIGIVLCAGSVLVLSFLLEPNPAGLGTHQQLGLQPCGFLVMTQYPCPMCGMTTTFSLMTHGEIIGAIRNQPFGVVLYLGNIFVMICALLDVIWGGKRISMIHKRILKKRGFWGVILCLGIVLGWFYKIILFSTNTL